MVLRFLPCGFELPTLILPKQQSGVPEGVFEKPALLFLFLFAALADTFSSVKLSLYLTSSHKAFRPSFFVCSSSCGVVGAFVPGGQSLFSRHVAKPDPTGLVYDGLSTPLG